MMLYIMGIKVPFDCVDPSVVKTTFCDLILDFILEVNQMVSAIF